MSNNRKQNKFLTFLFSNIAIIALVAITIWLGVASAKVLYAKITVRSEIDSLKREIEEMEQGNNELASLVDLFQNPEVIELEAKRRLNLKKPGEEVAVILRDKNDESQNIVRKSEVVVKNDEDSENKEPSNALKWWRYITDTK